MLEDRLLVGGQMQQHALLGVERFQGNRLAAEEDAGVGGHLQRALARAVLANRDGVLVRVDADQERRHERQFDADGVDVIVVVQGEKDAHAFAHIFQRDRALDVGADLDVLAGEVQCLLAGVAVAQRLDRDGAHFHVELLDNADGAALGPAVAVLDTLLRPSFAVLGALLLRLTIAVARPLFLLFTFAVARLLSFLE